MLNSEERFYLALGIKRFGAESFEKILAYYRFAPERTAHELELEWHKNHTKAANVDDVLNDEEDVNTLYDIAKETKPLGIYPVLQERLVDRICEELQHLASMLAPMSSDDEDDKDIQRKHHQLEWTRTRLDALMATWIACENPQRKLVWRILEACLPVETRALTADWLVMMSDYSTLSQGKSTSTKAKRIWLTIMQEIRAAELEADISPTLPLLHVIVRLTYADNDDIITFANECLKKWSTSAQAFDGEARRLCKVLLLL